ncbi:hypothetical protein JCM10908_003102 [Rhodotorula pacifica]|uniref:glucan 1,4-alpha-glucosidase n=1 Tax=Rhodotorula pacifica TaxID=1495444 RepID=UPI003176B175
MQKVINFLRLGPEPVRGKTPPEGQGPPGGGGPPAAAAANKEAAPADKATPTGSSSKAATKSASTRNIRKAEPNPLVKLPLADFIAKQTPFAWERLTANIFPEGTTPGCVVASPSKALPDYWYQWTRDSAVCERVLVERFVDEGREEDWKRLTEYVEASRIMQHKETVIGGFQNGGLGEVKYHVDYEPFTGPWGRPQPDGPGSRIITLATLAIYLLTTGDESKIAYVKRALYPGTPSERIEYAGVVKGDLEYVATSWRKYGFDLWEEVSGHHFYTLLTLRTALFLGARLANQLGDVSASTRYMAAADEIDPYLRRFWDDERGIMKVTIEFGKEPEAGAHSGTSDGNDSVVAQQQKQEEPKEADSNEEWRKLEKVVKADETYGKTSGLDIAIVLAVLHAGRGTSWARITTGIDAVAEPPFESATKVLATLVELMDQFSVRYPLNAGRRANGHAVAMGRYDEDVYDGVHMSIAHPWYLCTLGAAEFLFLLVSDLTALARNPTTTMLPLTPLLHSTLTRLLPSLNPPLPAVNTALSPSDPAFGALVRGLLALGDSFIAVVQEFVGQRGHLSEQFERDGIPRGSEPHESGQIEDSKRDYSNGAKGENEVEAIGRGARDLSWSYAAWITCVDERQRAVKGAERAKL